MSISIITRDELKVWIEQKGDFTLIDTGLAESYQSVHLPGALNACVYEVNFLDQVRNLHGIKSSASDNPGIPGLDPESIVVVYGSSARSLGSATAAIKLTGAGFTRVLDFREGLAGWREAGFPIVLDPHGAKSRHSIQDGPYEIDTKASKVGWTGRSLTGEHRGTIDLAAGQIEVRNGSATKGKFTLEMNSITDTDIDDPQMRSLLEKHLRSDDFFDTDKFPTAEFALRKISSITPMAAGSPDHEVVGLLTLKGVEREIVFTSLIGPGEETGTLLAHAHFDLDRTHWNVLYGSCRFYENLGKHLVSDIVSLEIGIVARFAGK